MATVVAPILSPERWSSYTAGSITLTARAGEGTDVSFVPLGDADRAVRMIAPGAFFFVPAGTTVTPADGPTIAAGPSTNVLVLHNVAAWDWAGDLAPIGQPVADWWALEGVTLASVETYIDGLPLDALAAARKYASGAQLKAEVLAGSASITVLDGNIVANLEPDGTGRVTLGVSCFAGAVEVSALSALATLPALDGNLLTHPLVVAAAAGAQASDLSIHVRFVHFEPKAGNAASAVDKGAVVPIPSRPGATIALQKRSAAGAYEDLASAPVTTGGQVEITLSRADLGSKVDLAAGDRLLFRLRLPGARFTAQYQHDGAPRASKAGLQWKGVADEWATEGMVTTDRSVGSLDFIARVDPATGATVGPAGTSVGSVVQPLEYYAGVPLFVQVQYPVLFVVAASAGQAFKSEIRPAPKGVVLTLRNAAGALGSFRTDEHGQVWGLVTSWNPDDQALEARVEYSMADPSVMLVEISGAVGAIGSAGEARFFSSQSDTEHPLGFGFDGCTIGQRIVASADSGLETLQVGSIAITNGDQDVTCTGGRHAAVLFAFQHIRYIHQWFHHLTAGFRLNQKDLAWSTLLDANTKGTVGPFTIVPPIVRVQPPPAAAPLRMGEIAFENDTLPIAGTSTSVLRWVLALYGNETFSLSTTAHTGVNVVEMWRLHTVWHEYTHAVFDIAYDLMRDITGIYTDFTNAKDITTSNSINLPHDGWSALEEAFAALPEVALLEQTTGRPPVISSDAVFTSGAPQFWTAEPRPAGGPSYFLNEGLLVARATDPTTGQLVRGVLDKRFGLLVPEAFTWALWTALKKLGTFASMATLCTRTRGVPTAHDLRDDALYLRSAANVTLFQRLVWGPLMRLRTPDVAGPPRMWNDIDPTSPGAANGDHATSPLRSTQGPTTLRFIEHFKTTYYPLLGASDRATVRNLFGNVGDATATQPTDRIAYYLWFLPW